jgi:hypothetical protein
VLREAAGGDGHALICTLGLFVMRLLNLERQPQNTTDSRLMSTLQLPFTRETLHTLPTCNAHKCELLQRIAWLLTTFSDWWYMTDI